MSELSGQVRADLHEAFLADRLLRPLRLVGGADDVDDVDVRDVVELLSPGLPHGDHGEGHLIGLRSDGSACDEQGRVQGRVGELGHATAHGGDVFERVRAGEVVSDDRREPVPVGAPQRSGRPVDGRVSRARGFLIAVRGSCVGRVSLPQCILDRPLQHRTGTGLLWGVPSPDGSKRGETLGVGYEEVAQGLRGAQDREQAAPVLTRLRGRIAHDAAQECCWCRRAPGLNAARSAPVTRLGCGCGLGESDEAEQSHVGISGESQGVDELLTGRPESRVSRATAWPPEAIR